MFRKALLAHTALAGVLAFGSPLAMAADLTVDGTSTSGTVALTSGQSLTVEAGGTVTSSTSTAAVGQTGTVDGASASITNAGTISNTYGSGGRAIDINDNTKYRTLTITNSGSISATEDAIRVNKALASGTTLTITNSGTIRSTTGQALDLKAMTAASGVSATITNTATGIISADAADVIRPGVGANIVNAGVICAGTYSAGACTSSTSTGDGIDGQDNTGITITNQTGGLISGAKHGITGESGPTVTNQSGATIEGRNGSGVNIDNADIDETSGAFTALRTAATVTNYGTITGTGTDGDGVDVDGQVILYNYGTINAQSATGVNTAEAVAAGGGTIVNYAGATLTGAHNGILIDNGSTGADYSAARATTITNAGTITGQNGYAIKLVGSTGYGSASLDDTITNSGIIQSAGGATVIDMGGGNDTLTTTGTISGTGATTVLQMGLGDDQVTINGGTISGGAIEGGDGADSLAFFNGATGTFTFAGAINGFETARVYAGTVVLQGAFAASTALTVDAGASLQVDPSFSVGALTVNGTLAAAENSATRTTTVTGDYSQGADGVLEVRIASASAHDIVAVTGTATLSDGATIRPKVDSYIADGTAVTFLTSSDLTATINQITLDYSSPLLTWALSESGDDLVLTATRSQTFASVSTTGAASAAGSVLEQIGSTASGDMQTVITTVQGQSSTAAVASAMNQLAPTPSGAALQGGRAASAGTINTVQTRMAALRNGQNGQVAMAESSALALNQSGEALAAATSLDGDNAMGPLLGVSSSVGAARAGVWAQGFGSNANQSARGDSQGYKSQTAGFAIGGDLPLDEDTVVGFAGSFARTFVVGRGTQDQDKSRIDSYQFTAYATRSYGAAFVEATLSGAYNTYDSKRVISFLDRTANADYAGWQGVGRVTAGHAFPSGSLTLTPLAWLQYAHTHLNSSTEPDAGSASLAVDSQDYDTLTPGIGVRLETDPFSVGEGSLTPQFTAGLGYDVVSDRQSVTSAFTGGGASFESQGEEPARTSFTAGIGASYRIDDMELAAGYQLELRDQYVGHAALLRLRHDL